MKIYEKAVENRKVLVDRIAELTLKEAVYTPRCAFEIGLFTVEKNGRLVANDGSELGIITILQHEGLIGDIINSEISSNLSVSFPLEQHTVRSLLNLIYTVYSRGVQLSKATQGNFYIDKYLIDTLAEDENFGTKEELIDFIHGQIEDGRRCEGISFDTDNVILDGFKNAPELADIYRRLAAQMNKFAIGSKKIRAKEITEPNEKYSFRVWLVRMGMSGPEFKADRKELMKRLSGHSAFRTEADRQKWIARYKNRSGVVDAVIDRVVETFHQNEEKVI